MAHLKPIALALLVPAVVWLASSSAQAVDVQALGDAAWDSGDTRAAGYLNNNNPPDNQLIPGRVRADNPSLLEDTLIAPRLNFGTPAIAPPVGPGALHLVTDQSADKATLDKRGLDTPLADPFLSFDYAWLRVGDATSTVAAPALKLIIDTDEVNPAGDTAQDRGETQGDKILVYEPYHQATTLDDIWTPESITPTEGKWWLVNLDGGSAMPPTNQADLRTLADWATAFDFSGLGLNTKIVSIQIGIGSGNPELDTYVDHLQMSSGDGTTQWNFGVPEPTSIVLAALSSACLFTRRSRQGKSY